jgi:hypothetical protein
MASYYVVLLTSTWLVYQLAMLLGSAEGTANNSLASMGQKNVSGSGIVFFLASVPAISIYMFLNAITIWSSFYKYVAVDSSTYNEVIRWFGLELTNQVWISHAFVLANLLIVGAWLGYNLRRRYHDPNAALITRKQSYFMVAYLEAFMLGFAVNGRALDAANSLYVLNLMLFMVLIQLLSPQRQDLIDWARYAASNRQQAASQRRGIFSFLPHPAVIRDLLWSDKSPAPLAIIVNMAIVFAILIPQTFRWDQELFNTRAYLSLMVGMVLLGMILAIAAVLVQICMFMKNQNTRFMGIWQHWFSIIFATCSIWHF